MKQIRYTLLGDGPSDKALLPLLDWLLRKHYADYAIQSEWADPSLIPGAKGLSERIRKSLELYPCDLLFVHRDAEKEPLDHRVKEIQTALKHIINLQHPVVFVIPIRMQEAWLLFDELAIRRAVGNPNGKTELKLPPLKGIEHLPDPKEVLNELLRKASELHGGRLRKMRVSHVAQRVAYYIDDFAPLLYLEAFQHLQTQIEELVQSKWPETKQK